MYDLETIRQMNNEHTSAEELGKAMTYAEIQAAARQEDIDDRYDSPTGESFSERSEH